MRLRPLPAAVAEEEMICAAGTDYVYNGDGERVEKSSGTLYWDGGLAESDLSGNLTSEYISFNNKRIARRDVSSGSVYYYFSDLLGSSNVVTNATGAVENESDFYPFGGEYQVSNSIANHYKFTGKERDAESGNDYFGARHYRSSMGRFMSPDPMLNSGRPDDPQTWNRYTYALNNPLVVTDPTGLYNLINNCASDNKQCNADFATNASDLKNAVSALTTAVNGLKDGDQKTALQASLKALGTENDGNNIGVQFGATGDHSAAQTVPGADSSGKLNFTITFDPSKNQGMVNEAVNAAHEGTHVADLSDPRFNDQNTTLSPFSMEYRGYRTSAYAAAALGQGSWSFKGQNGKGSYPIWNGSWGAVDKNITRYVTTFRGSNGQPDHPETTPHDPWSK